MAGTLTNGEHFSGRLGKIAHDPVGDARSPRPSWRSQATETDHTEVAELVVGWPRRRWPLVRTDEHVNGGGRRASRAREQSQDHRRRRAWTHTHPTPATPAT